MSDFMNKHVLVTGGSSGIGLGIALGFARAGAKVTITARTPSRIDSAIGQAAEQGLTLRGLTCNVSQACVAEAAQQWGGLDIVCCNAGIFPSAPLADMSEQQWDEVQAINSKGTFLTVQAALPWLKRAEYGRIILTSSITGPVTGYPGWAHYAASKAAQLGFMRSAALELAGDNITVLPGNIVTEGLRDMGEDYIAGMASAVPLKRLGTVEDIAAAALFFASRQAGYITGQSLIVDGGQILPESAACLN